MMNSTNLPLGPVLQLDLYGSVFLVQHKNQSY
nr:MAG TPA_asm: hypothetical protein [Caudoviricetes sp.]